MLNNGQEWTGIKNCEVTGNLTYVYIIKIHRTIREQKNGDVTSNLTYINTIFLMMSPVT